MQPQASAKKKTTGGNGMWLGLALLSALFAALTSILAKVGIEGVNSNLATAIRTGVVLLMAWGMVFLTNAQGGIPAISTKSSFSRAWPPAAPGCATIRHCSWGKSARWYRWIN